MRIKIKNNLYKIMLSILLIVPKLSLAQFDVVDINTGAELPDGAITEIVSGIMKWILGLVGIFGIIGFAIAGIFYLTSAGNEGQMEKGKNGMVWSIIGVIVALMGFVMIQAIDIMLTGTDPTF